MEDHTDTREMYAEVFSHAGLHTVEATNAENALRRATAIRPAVIVTDLHLGWELDGLRLCERLKKDPATKDIPLILLIDASSDTEFREQAEGAGCLAVWLKPTDPFVLVDEVRKFVESHPTKE